MTPPRATRRAAWAALLALCAPAVAQPAGERDRQAATRWADEADTAHAEGDSRRAGALWLRASRWDPERVDLLAKAVAAWERVRPTLAVRHATRLLDADPRFGLDSPALLLRLRERASEMNTVEGDSAAAAFLRRVVAWGERSGSLSQQRVARLWSEVGEYHLSAGQIDQASEALDRFQRLASVGEGDDARQTLWGVVASAHLGARQPARAAVAVELHVAQHGEDAEAFAGRARIAQLLDEPMEAAAHARRAVEQADGPIPLLGDQSPYELLLETLHAINQADHAAEELLALRDRGRDDPELDAAIVAALHARGEPQRAWEENGRLIDKLLERTPRADPLFDTGEADPAVVARLADAAGTRLELAAELGRTDRLGDELTAWSTRFDWTDELANLVAGLDPDAPSARRLHAWATARLEAEGSPPSEETRTALAVALASGDVALANACLRQRLEAAGKAGAGRDALLTELETALSYSGAQGFPTTVDLLDWAIPFLEETPDDADDGAFRLARLKAWLARGLAAQDDADHATAERVNRLLREAEQAAPDAPTISLERFAALQRLGDDAAIEAGAEFLERWETVGPTDDCGESFYGWAIMQLANLYETRGLPGDEQEAIELYETTLDRFPDHAAALNNLAYLWSDDPEKHARAERMVRRAVRLEPGNAGYLDTLGWLLVEQGRVAEGAETLAKAAENLPDGADPEAVRVIRGHHAEALRRLGLAEEAEAAGAP